MGILPRSARASRRGDATGASRLTFRVALCTVLLAGAVAATADAHRPIAIDEPHPSRDEALLIEDLDVSQVAYVELTAVEPEFWLVFQVADPVDVDFSLGVPAIDRLSGYRPTVTLIGPDGADAEELAFETSSVEAPERFHEPFTGTDSWILLQETTSLSEPGTYYLVASAASEAADKLWIAVGTREAFGLADVLSLPSIVREVRAFHEVGFEGPSRREWAGLIAFGLIAVVLALCVFGQSD